ncbi:MAG: PAS domain S-box protein [Sneathiella sp.]|nr:PAS domain S-box protein [Sneathiella sp.]
MSIRSEPDQIIGLLCQSEILCPHFFTQFSDQFRENALGDHCKLYLFDPRNSLIRQHLPTLTPRRLSWSDFQRDSSSPELWKIPNPTPVFLDNPLTKDHEIHAMVTCGPKQEENGILVFTRAAGSQIDDTQSQLFSLVKFQIGNLISKASHQSPLDKSKNPYIIQAIQSIKDSYIIYDKEDRVVTFSPQHLYYYPWMRGHLHEGAHFDDLREIFGRSNEAKILDNQGKPQISRRVPPQKGEPTSTDMSFKDGRVVRLRDTRLPNGGWATVLTDITAFRKNEIALKKEKKEYKDLLEASPDAICITVSHRMSYVNNRLAKMLNTPSLDKFLGKSGYSLIHPEDRQKFTDFRNLNAEKSETEALEIRLKRLDGSSFYADLTTAPVIWEGQAAKLWTIRDVSYRKEIIRKLAQREKEMAAAQMLASSGYWTLNLDTNEMRFSDESHILLGFDPKENSLTAKQLVEMFPQGEYEKIDRAIAAGIKSQEPFDYVHTIFVNEELKYVRVRAKLLHDEANGSSFVFGVSRDVTEQKKMEIALVESEKRFRDLTKASADLHWELDIDLKFSFISDTVEELVGYPPEFYLGKTVTAIFGDTATDENGISPLLKKFDSHVSFRDMVFQRSHSSTGRTTWIRCSGAPYYDESGKFLGYRGSNTNITAQMELAEQLKQSQKMEAVGQLTGGIAHDFNNLLAVIQGNAELLLEEKLFEKDLSNTNKLTAIIRSTAKGADLTQHMLAYSRKQALSPSIVHLKACIENMIGLLKRTLGAHIHFDVQTAENLWSCFIDANQIENAVLNLALNARDAMPDGGTLQIKLANIKHTTDHLKDGTKLHAGAYVILTITDTGTGISDSDLELVFDPFFTTKEVGKGTGLGLSVVSGFVRQSKGTITIESKVEEGTTINLYLPAQP